MRKAVERLFSKGKKSVNLGFQNSEFYAFSLS
jgi:hypothetical protein